MHGGIDLLSLNLLLQAAEHAKLDILGSLYVFVLATFVGLEVIRKVSPLLHTPLMSLTNAISAIAVVAAIEIAGKDYPTYATVLGTLAITCSFANVVGGFLITDRMLRMFKKRERTKASSDAAAGKDDAKR
jgi:NAD(P) transhydrogenase subunit alpha